MPYAGVKTDVLYFTEAYEPNNQKEYWYFDVKNIGYTLDNHRRKIKGKNDLNKLAESDFCRAVKNEDVRELLLEIGFEIVPMTKVKSNDYNLVGNHYREIARGSGKWDIVKLADVILDIKDGGTPPRQGAESTSYFGGDINWCVVKDIQPEIHDTAEKLTALGLQSCSAKLWPIDTIIISLGATIGNVGIAKKPTATKQGLSGIIVDKTKILPKYLYHILLSKREEIKAMGVGATIKEVRPSRLKEHLTFPLPPIEEQEAIIEKITNYQEIIDKTTQTIKLMENKISEQIASLW